MVINNNKLNNKEFYCDICNDKEQVAVQTEYGEYEIEECLCVMQKFFERHGIGVEDIDQEDNR
jgi:transcription initiation factor TFIIIB Brf1 subunit/transcription initiation factor TFIIB